MSGWTCAGLVVLGFALLTLWTCLAILQDNRPGPRWPGDP